MTNEYPDIFALEKINEYLDKWYIRLNIFEYLNIRPTLAPRQRGGSDTQGLEAVDWKKFWWALYKAKALLEEFKMQAIADMEAAWILREKGTI